MSDVASAEADLAKAEAELAAAEQKQEPSLLDKVADVVAPVKEGEQPAAEKSTEELLAAAPPLVMPEGQHIIKVCPGCGLRLQDPPANLVCPNCRTIVP